MNDFPKIGSMITLVERGEYPFLVLGYEHYHYWIILLSPKGEIVPIIWNPEDWYSVPEDYLDE